VNYEGVDHISYTVTDLDRSIEFYTLLLGEEPFLRKTWDQEYAAPLCGYDRVVLEGAFWNLPQAPVLELLEFKVPKAAPAELEMHKLGAAHLGLVCADMRAEYERLQAAGVEFQSRELVEIPWGPYKGGLACFVRDPDGIFIELFQLPPGGRALE
jgi:catechol 2,3-dioxygenase-like lactoylglutathione lyase family enzyme